MLSAMRVALGDIDEVEGELAMRASSPFFISLRVNTPPLAANASSGFGL